MESEFEYRKRIQGLFDRIEAALESTDPDLAECEQAMGALTITLADGSRIVLSAQPSVRQLWLANAKEGLAYHFSFHPEENRWMDDKGAGVECIQVLEKVLSKALGSPLKINPRD